MRVSSKKAVLFIVVLLLIALLVCSMVACKSKKEKQPDPPSNVAEGDLLTEDIDLSGVDLDVSFDADAVLSDASPEDLSEVISVEVEVNGAKKKVDFSVKSVKVTEDGQFLDVIVSALGLEKSIRVPCLSAQALLIREELRPLYRLLAQDGAKSYSLSFDSQVKSSSAGDADGFSLEMLVNESEDKSINVALVTGKQEDKKVIGFYDGETVMIGGAKVEMSRVRRLMDDFDVALIGSSTLSDEEGESADKEGDFRSDLRENLDSVFIALSTVLKPFDDISDSSILSTMKLDFRHEGDTYTLKANSKKLLALADLLLNENQKSIMHYDLLVDMIDLQTAGAFKAGKVEITFSFAIKENGVEIGVVAEDKDSDLTLSTSLALAISDKAFELPEKDATLKDLQISMPISLPQKVKTLTLTAILHTSEFFAEAGDRDYVTAYLSYNDKKDIVRGVLNEKYLYVDASGLAKAIGTSEEQLSEYTYYLAFENEDGSMSFVDMLHSIIGALSEEPEVIEEEEEEENDPRFENGYGYTVVGDDLRFPIGSTEKDLRDRLIVTVYNEEGEEEEYTDYSLVGFDASASAYGEVTIVFSKNHEMAIDNVIFYDPGKVKENSIYVNNLIVALNTPLAEAEALLDATVIYTDGTVRWEGLIDGFVIDMIDFMPVGAALDKTGNHFLQVKRKETAAVYYSFAYVYDPENLIAVDMDCSGTVYLQKGSTEADLREELWVTVEYDDGSMENVDDYEIVGFSQDATSIEVCWQKFKRTVAIETYDDGSEEEELVEESESLLSYIRFLKKDETIDTADLGELYDKLQPIVEKNKKLFLEVFTFTKSEKGATVDVAINKANDRDLLAIANLFLGMPTEEGFRDIEEEDVIAILEKELGSDKMFSLSLAFTQLFGVSLSDFLKDLSLDAAISWSDDGASIHLEIKKDDSVKYLVTGIEVKPVDAVASFEVTESAIEKAQKLSGAPQAILMNMAWLFIV